MDKYKKIVQHKKENAGNYHTNKEWIWLDQQQ